MFAMIARTQWQWTRGLVAGIALLAFLAPAIAWRMASSTGSVFIVQNLANAAATLGPILAMLALLGPFVLAAYPWLIDAEAKHVYPLSLPLPWRRFVAMRYAVGALTLLIPALALYLGARFAASMVELPELLRAYPGALSFRFLLAMLVSYSLTFALQYLAGRRASLVALLVLVSVVAVVMTLVAIGQEGALETLARVLFETPGIFAIFVGDWTLIDV